MTSIWDASGRNIPCTVIEAGPCVVTQVKTKEKDGYDAIQLSFGVSMEFTRFEEGHRKSFGEVLTADVFAEGEFIDVAGVTKGHGFQGVVGRHGFGGVGQKTHGQHNRLRAPGSVGASSYPSRLFKGLRMAGQTGHVRRKVTNLEVVKVIVEKNLILVKGSVPGPKGSFLKLERWS